MGLDLVELAIEIEERFNITFPDADAQFLDTPRKVIDYVTNRVTTVTASPLCVSQRSFYAVRRAMIKRFGIDRNVIKPTAELEAIIPRAGRPHVWNSLKRDLAVHKWPDLQRPPTLFAVLFGITAALAIAVAGVSLLYFELGFALELAALTTLAVGWFLARLTYRYKKRFPARCTTAGDLTKLVAAHTALPPVVYVSKETREEVAMIIHQLICENLGITRSDYTEDSRFVEDIGAS